MPVDASTLSEIIAAAQKRFGGIQTMRMGDELPSYKSISWGSLELDMATWGGARMGTMVRLWGKKGSLKTTMAFHLAAQAQNYKSNDFPDGLVVAYYPVESIYDEEYVASLGVDTSKLVVTDKFINAIEDLVIQMQGLLTAAHIHIIDSVGFGVSRERLETTPGESMSRGSKARAWTDYLPDLKSRMDRDNMIVFIDQVRRNQKYGQDVPSSDSISAFGHDIDMDLHFMPPKALYRAADGGLVDTRPKKSNVITLGGEILTSGLEVGIEVEKSKVCRQHGKARLVWDHDQRAFDAIEQLKKVGIFLNVIGQSGGYYTIPTSDKSIHGDPKLRARISEDDALVMAIYAAKNKYLSQNGYRAGAAV